MKIYSLEFVCDEDVSAERIWHTNRRALERYASSLDRSRFRVTGIKSFDMPAPLTEARVVAFLNAHCGNFLPCESPQSDEEPRAGGARSA